MRKPWPNAASSRSRSIPPLPAEAVATLVMSRSISRSYKDSYTMEQRDKVIDHINQQRWADAEAGRYALGFHESRSTGTATS
jgi:hypothetical protein